METVIKNPLVKTSIDAKVLQAQITLSYQQVLVIAISAVFASATLAIVLWSNLPKPTLIASLCIGLAGAFLGPGSLYLAFRLAKPQAKDLRRWKTLLTVFAGIGTLSWGGACVLQYSTDSVVLQFFVLLIVVMGAGKITLLTAAYKPAFYVCLFSLLLPLSVRFLLEGDTLHTVIGLGVPAIYGGTLIYLYQNIHNTLLESIRSRFEKEELAAQLELLKSAAEQASINKSQFLAAASHDLRQPLHAQGLFLEELQERVSDTASLTIVKKAQQSLEAMSTLFNSILDLSRIDAGIVVPHKRGVALAEVFHELLLDFQQEAAAKNIQLIVVESKSIVHTDRELLARILRNLIANAIRYTHSGKVVVGCRRQRDRQVRIEVLDTGLGIEKHVLPFIFQEYYQIGDPKPDRDNGVGLGLSIVARLAKLLQHPIDVRSEYRKGSVFSITLPLTDVSAPARVPSAALANTVPSGKVTYALKVLVIDDNDSILNAMRSLLEQWGWSVLTARHPEEAIKALHACTQDIDLIIADYRLQNGVTGIQAIEGVCGKLGRKVPALLVTGDTSPDILKTLYNSGYRVVHKPIAPAKLRSLINFTFQETSMISGISSHSAGT